MFVKYLKYSFILVLLSSLLAFSFFYFHPIFGAVSDSDSMAKIQASKQFDGVQFTNIEPTPRKTPQANAPSSLDWLISVVNPPPGKRPQEPLPSVQLDVSAMQDGDLVWLGHSTVVLKVAGKTVITDPVFYRASPVPFIGNPFLMTHTPRTEDLPALDAVLITHDHYDHLDYRAIQEIQERTKYFYVPLGIKAYLQRWGVASDKIIELDWHEQAQLDQVSFILTPARHYSLRTPLKPINVTTLWGSWVIQSPDLSVYMSGDTGYGQHFADIGQRYGPFDLALIESGAYNENWGLIHMFPEQSVQAALDVQAKAVMPIHWAKFDLAYHGWKEPIERFMAAIQNKPIQAATPKIGQIFNLNQLPTDRWWVSIK